MDLKRFGVAFGAKYLERHLDDDKFWSDLLRRRLNPMLKEVDPILMVQYFEEKLDFTKLLNSDHLDIIKQYTEGNEDLLQKLKSRIERKLIQFEWSWIEQWWKKDHPDLLGVVINHPSRIEFQQYLKNGIEDLSKQVKNTF